MWGHSKYIELGRIRVRCELAEAIRMGVTPLGVRDYVHASEVAAGDLISLGGVYDAESGKRLGYQGIFNRAGKWAIGLKVGDKLALTANVSVNVICDEITGAVILRCVEIKRPTKIERI